MNDELPPQLQAIAGRIADGWADTIDIGPGWFDLLARLDRQLAEISPGYVIEQCKTKFGTLRYYARPEDADHTDAARFSDIIRDAEDESATVCEDCGQPAQQVTSRGWVWTLCTAHAQQRTNPSEMSAG